MSGSRGLAVYGYALLAAVFSAAAGAQGWAPQRNVEIMVPNAQGSSLDTSARIVHKVMQDLKLVPTPIVLINRAGGEQSVGYTYLRTRAGDPHYIGFANPALLGNHISGRMAFTYTDFTPISFLLTDDYVFAARADSPFKTGADMVEALKKRPDALAIATATIQSRIAVGLVLQSAGIENKPVRMVVQPGGQQVPTLLGGHIDVSVGPPAQYLPHVEAGTLRVIASTSPKRLGGALATAPTWDEQGHKAGTYGTWRALIAAKGVTAAQTAFWEDVMRKVAESDEFRAAARKNQAEPVFLDAAATRQRMETEYEQAKGVLTYLGMIK